MPSAEACAMTSPVVASRRATTLRAPLPASLDKTLELHGCSSHPLDHERNALADADAHGAERVTLVRSKQLIHRRRREARAACAEWMAQCDGAAIRIDVLRVIRDPEQAKHGERLRR